MIKYVNRDIVTITEGLVIHGTNCSGAFGAGVAAAVRKEWPSVYFAFISAGTGKHLLGQFKPVKISDTLVVGNCYTQERFGAANMRYASAKAIMRSVAAALKYATDNNISSVYMPKIGSGLGGLSWSGDVEPIIKELSQQYKNITINICYI